MDFDRPKWYARGIRRQQLDDYIESTGKATFGFREMAASEKESWVRRHFDRVAPYYDFMNTLCSLGIHYVWKRMAVNRLHLQPGAVVLDVCGGTGDLSMLADAAVGPTGKVLLFDINREMILAGRNSPNHRDARKRIHYIQGNAEAICLPEATCDAAMVGFGIRNVTRLKRAFSEMYRVLKPGGRFMCLEFSKPVNPAFRRLYDFHSFHVMPLLGQLLVGNREGYQCLPETIRLFSLPEELVSMLGDVGFQDVAFRRLTNGIAVIHTGRRPG
jgi:demethylmenaquinone methyltransferase/2-methoxy-6-polyprenyl-1,4-benzoquinol methylase